MSTGKPKDNEFQMVAAPGTSKPPLPPSSNAIVEYTPPVFKEEEEDLEIKLRRIIDNVPVRVSNTSGSSAGSGSGDFHQVKLLISFIIMLLNQKIRALSCVTQLCLGTV
jgi:hypothetical protein